MLAGVPVSQNQPQSSASVAPANSEQQQYHQNQSPEELQSQPQPQFTFPNYSFPTTFPFNSLPDHDLNLNMTQWFDYMRLLAVQSSSPGLYMPPITTPLWNPFSMIAMQNACAPLLTFPDLQKLSDLMIQRNYSNICGNNGAQYPNDLQAAEILAAIPSIIILVLVVVAVAVASSSNNSSSSSSSSNTINISSIIIVVVVVVVVVIVITIE
ncbi:hypothetical protein DINM_020697 [Dirofilaria immitis]|nr:hypothetical protein [Dirofilaria immitis]